MIPRILPSITFSLITSVTFAVGCGGESESETNPTSGPALESVSDLPSLDPSNYDYSTSNALEGLLKSNARNREMLAGASEGDFSRAACEGYTLKRRLFQDAQQVDSFLCYIKTLEQSSIGMTIPADQWAYYAIAFAEHSGENGPPTSVRVRIGKFANQLRMDACVPNGDSWSRDVEIQFEATETGYTGHVANTYTFENEGRAMSGQSAIEVAIEGTSAQDFTSAQFNSFHQDSDVNGKGWQQLASFTADDATKINTLSGANSFESLEWGANAGSMFGEWGSDLVGSVKFETNGEYYPPTEEQCREWGTPEDFIQFCAGKCYQEGQEIAVNENGRCPYTFGGTESFSIDSSTTPPTFAVVADDMSAYYSVVDASTLPTIADIEANLGFVDEWDCEADISFQPVDATGISEVESCEPERDEEMWRMCEEQERAAHSAE